MPPEKIRLTGQEKLLSGDLDLPESTVLDFWQWAFSGLRANNLRGIFAEWLVARLLQIEQPVRDSWAAWDLETPAGVKIEVKAAAYLQAWEQQGPSKIVFSGLQGRTWDPLQGYSASPTYNADLYIFCLQTETDPQRWNPLDLSQWVFYIMSRETLAALGLKSISLQKLAKIGRKCLAAELRPAVKELATGLAP